MTTEEVVAILQKRAETTIKEMEMHKREVERLTHEHWSLFCAIQDIKGRIASERKEAENGEEKEN